MDWNIEFFSGRFNYCLRFMYLCVCVRVYTYVAQVYPVSTHRCHKWLSGIFLFIFCLFLGGRVFFPLYQSLIFSQLTENPESSHDPPVSPSESWTNKHMGDT